ncbi:MAG: fused MFS/spermidine synthase [Deltaproteobacteria bacterium]|nr:fused MFS/spermidine synthase [Deltaproteobacteria bacterium]
MLDRVDRPLGARAHRAVLATLFTLSGASGLAFEVLWTRQLSVVLGGTHRSVTFVVALFMAGLGLGAAAGTRLAVASPRATRTYGLVELGIALAAGLATTILPRLETVSSDVIRVGAAMLLVLAPSALMGATFPVVATAYASRVGDDRADEQGPGLLYALNTAGAVVGCLLTGFLAIGVLGLRATGLAGAALNALCGLGALALSRASRSTSPASAAPEPTAHRAVDRPALALALGLAAAAGCVALAEEIFWVRALLPYVNSSTYAFSAILATYLLGLALGAAWAATRVSPARAAIALSAVQAAAAAAVAATPHLLRVVDVLFPQYVGVQRARTLGAWLGTVAGVFGKTSLVLLPPTLLLGATVPLCIALAGRAGLRGGARAGLTSAFNTVGGIVGTVAAGLVVLPAVGVVRGIQLAAAAHLAIAVAAASAAPGVRALRVGLGSAAAALAVLVVTGDAAPFAGRVAEGWRLLLTDEGPQDTTTVVERPLGRGRTRGILSNGVMYAGDSISSRRYMSLLGHLPALLSRDPSAAMVICVGTGTTAAALAAHPAVRSLELVDISPAVHRTLPFFVDVNRSVWRDPRVRFREADGRRFMVGRDRRYGVITLEPPPPRMAGAASLYTLEMYERARQALTDGGTIAQWIPLHGMTARETFMLVRTFQRVFPSAALFLLTDDEAAVIARRDGRGFSSATLAAGLSAPAVARDLRELGFDGDRLAAAVLALGVAQGVALRELVGDGPVVSDDRPLIEHFAVGLGAGGAGDDGRLALLRAVASRGVTPVRMDGERPAGADEAAAALHARIARLVAP